MIKNIFFILIILFATTLIVSEFKFPNKKFKKCYKYCKKNIEKEKEKCVEYCLPMVHEIFKETKKKKVQEMSDSSEQYVSANTIWNRYRTALFDFFSKGDASIAKNLMIFTDPFPAGDFDTESSLAQFLNIVPKYQGTFESWDRTQIQLPNVYGDFLNTCPREEFSASEIEQINNLYQKVRDTKKELIECQNKYPGVEYACDVEEIKYSSAIQANWAVTKNEKRLVSSAIAAFQLKNKYVWEKIGLISNLNNRSSKFTIEIDSEKSISSEKTKTSSFGVKIEVSIGVVSVGVGVNSAKSTMDLHTNDKVFKMKIEGEYASYPVFIGNWYNALIVEKFSKKPEYSQFFGANGKLRLIPKTIFVIRKPIIYLKVSEDDLKKFEEMKSFGVGVTVKYAQVVGIGVDFTKGSTIKTSNNEKELYNVIIVGTEEPQVLMMDFFNNSE